MGRSCRNKCMRKPLRKRKNCWKRTTVKSELLIRLRHIRSSSLSISIHKCSRSNKYCNICNSSHLIHLLIITKEKIIRVKYFGKIVNNSPINSSFRTTTY